MADGISRIGVGNNYVGNYYPPKQGEGADPNVEPDTTLNNAEETQVDPAKVMDFLAGLNVYVPTTKVSTTIPNLDPETVERIERYTQNFELFYDIVVEEFGEKLALTVINMCMDYFSDLLDMAA